MLITQAATTGDPWRIVGASIYSASLVTLFTCSTLHHGLDLGERGDSVLRTLDYTAVFGLIAGTVTPLVLVHSFYIDGRLRQEPALAQQLEHLAGDRLVSAGIALVAQHLDAGVCGGTTHNNAVREWEPTRYSVSGETMAYRSTEIAAPPRMTRAGAEGKTLASYRTRRTGPNQRPITDTRSGRPVRRS